MLLDLEALAEISSNPAGQSLQEEQVDKPQREATPDRKDKKEKDNKRRSVDSRSTAAKKDQRVPRVKLTVEYQSKHGLNRYFTKFMVSLLHMFKLDQQSAEPKEREYFIIRYNYTVHSASISHSAF